uniref:Uncharacterized protein n=1 Tax=Leersia perrieri TaxID=77586 RepID=A0A0D9V1H8_9ORYZ
MANKYAASAEAIQAIEKKKDDKSSKDHKDANRSSDRKRRAEELVAATERFIHQRRFRIPDYKQVLAEKCPYHPTGNHSAKDCYMFKKYIKQQEVNVAANLAQWERMGLNSPRTYPLAVGNRVSGHFVWTLRTS